MAKKQDNPLRQLDPDPHVVLYGNLTEGFEVYGPFDSFDDAANWAEGKFLESWVMPLIDSNSGHNHPH